MRRRSTFAYGRREPTLEPYDTVLLVCEGEKTEPNYFNDMRAFHRLSTANVAVVSPGADPVTLVEYAMGRLKDFNRVFCVFDGENSARVAKALGLIASSPGGKSGILRAVVSTPCFEVWMLLHFKLSTAPFLSAGTMTAGQSVVSALKQHIPGYSKSSSGLYTRLAEKVPLAMANGRRLAKHNAASQSTNPATSMHDLVEYLRGLKAT